MSWPILNQQWIEDQWVRWCDRHSWYKLTKPTKILILPVWQTGELVKLVGHYPSIYFYNFQCLPVETGDPDWDSAIEQIIKQNGMMITGSNYNTLTKKLEWTMRTLDIWQELSNTGIPMSYLAERLSAENLNAVNE